MSECRAQAGVALLAQVDVQSAELLASLPDKTLLRVLLRAKETTDAGAASLDLMILVSLGSLAISRELLRRGVPEQATGREPANPQPTAPPHTFGAKDLSELAGMSVVPVTIAGVAFVPAPLQHLGRTDCEVRVTFKEIPRPVRLGRVAAEQIVEILGTSDTRDWIGRVVGIRVVDSGLDGGTQVAWKLAFCAAPAGSGGDGRGNG
ncbi:MAG: hypothetical protein AMXMBFR77_26680 [Phycisphaerales bacterium]